MGRHIAVWRVLAPVERPCVVYSGHDSREAAEVGLEEALGSMSDKSRVASPYGPSEVPVSYFNAVGRVLIEI